MFSPASLGVILQRPKRSRHRGSRHAVDAQVMHTREDGASFRRNASFHHASAVGKAVRLIHHPAHWWTASIAGRPVELQMSQLSNTAEWCGIKLRSLTTPIPVNTHPCRVRGAALALTTTSVRETSPPKNHCFGPELTGSKRTSPAALIDRRSKDTLDRRARQTSYYPI